MTTLNSDARHTLLYLRRRRYIRADQARRTVLALVDAGLVRWPAESHRALRLTEAGKRLADELKNGEARNV